MSIPLQNSPSLKISQQNKSEDIVVTSKLAIDELELQIDDVVSGSGKVEVEKLPGTTDKFKITTKTEGMQTVV